MTTRLIDSPRLWGEMFPSNKNYWEMLYIEAIEQSLSGAGEIRGFRVLLYTRLTVDP
jgi:hypothetical protein